MKSILSKNTLWGFLIFLPVALYFYFLSEYSINIPKWDDHALKAFIVEFQNADGFIPKLQTFFKQHNEHRIVFDRFFTLVVFWIHGSIEYRWLMWIGNFTLLGILFIFYKILEKQNISIVYLAPISLILFQLQLWENTFWGMAALQNFGIIFFILTLIYLISSEKKTHFYLAFFVAFLATFTSGNGITVFPVCLVLFVVQRRFKDAFIFGGISIILTLSYFYKFQFPLNNPSMEGIGIKEIIIGFCTFLGSVFDLIPNAIQSRKIIITGGFFLFISGSILAIYIFLNSKLLKKQRNNNSIDFFILGSLMFLIGTALVVTITRISYGAEGLLTSRYKIYSILLLITVYVSLLSKIEVNNIKWLSVPLIFMAFCFNSVANFTHFKDVINFRNQLISFAMNWKLEEKTDNILQINLYQTPFLNLESHMPEIRKTIKFAPIWKENHVKTVNSDGILLQNNSIILSMEKENNISLILQYGKKTYLIPSQLMSYPIKTFVRTGKYFQNGFVGTLNNNEFENGTYQLGIGIKSGENFKMYYLNDSLIVNNPKSKSVKTNW